MRIDMNKKERVIAAINGREVDRVPAGFSLHFPRQAAFDEAGVQSHLEFFAATDTDILKIMNENLVPDMGTIVSPNDWKNIKTISLNDPFMVRQIEMTKRILEKCDASAFTLGTLHGITASAIHPSEQKYGYDGVRRLLCAHLRENKAPVLDAMKRIADGMCLLAEKYIELGLDGVYYAALGGERHFFTDDEFEEYIAPYDKMILSAVRRAKGSGFLHICKENLNMNRYKGYDAFADVVNWGVYETHFSLEEGKKLFPEAAIMGGLANRSGVLVDGAPEELKQAVRALISSFGKKRFILGADCTLPTEIPYDRIRTAVHAAF